MAAMDARAICKAVVTIRGNMRQLVSWLDGSGNGKERLVDLDVEQAEPICHLSREERGGEKENRP